MHYESFYKQLILRVRVLLSMRSTREKQFTPFGLRATGWFFNVLILRTLRRHHGASSRVHAPARRLRRRLLGARQASHSAPIRRPAQANTEPLIVMRLSTHSQELSQTDAFRHYQAGLDGNVITTKALWS